MPDWLEIFEPPGYSIQLNLDLQDEGDAKPLTEVALKAVFEFMSDFCRPLTIDISTAYWEDDFDLPREVPAPSSSPRMALSAYKPKRSRLRTVWVDQSATEIGELNRENTREFVERALEFDSREYPQLTVGWTEIWVRSTMARLPAGRYRPGDELSVRRGAGVVTHPVEHISEDDWVAGPLDITASGPVEIQIVRDFGMLSMTVSIMWNIWMPGFPGSHFVESGVAKLLNSGWVLTQDEA